jgi:hypothetical protein
MNSPVQRDTALVAKLHLKIAEKAMNRGPKTLKLNAGSSAPVFEGMLQIVRNSGYTIGTAELELIDNSIDAGAKTIKIHVHSEDKIIHRIVTIDFGCGMSSPKLQRGWQMAGGSKSDRVEGAIGKFDIGMKGATLSTCKDITIASREIDGSISCLHADVDTMRALNRFEPTEFVEDADVDHLLKYFHPTDVDTFLSEPSGTIVQMKSFLSEMVSHVDTAVSELRQAISNAYPHHNSVHFFIQQDAEPETEIEKADVFYSASPTSIRFSYSTELAVYQADRSGAPLRVIETVKETRYWSGGGKAGRGTMIAGHSYEHSEIPKNGSSYKGSETEVSNAELEKIKSKLIGVIKVRVVQVTDETYKLEPEGIDAKGFHMRRDIRNVGSGMRLGYKFHDRASHAADRQRVEVIFPPAMDKVMGSTWNKTMRDGVLPQKVIGDALIRIYRQVTAEWTKQTERELVRQLVEDVESNDDTSSEEEESYADIPQPPISSFIATSDKVRQIPNSPYTAPTPNEAPQVVSPITTVAEIPTLASSSLPSPSPVSSLPDAQEKPVSDVCALVREFVSRLSELTLDERGAALLSYLSAYANE